MFIRSPSNILTFNADNNSSDDCNPTTDYTNIALLETLDLNSSGWYEIQSDFSNGTLPQGTQLIVHVQAIYANGEHLNDCQTLTLASSSTNYANISVEIRGNINNYSSSAVSYQVDIYQQN